MSDDDYNVAGSATEGVDPDSGFQELIIILSKYLDDDIDLTNFESDGGGAIREVYSKLQTNPTISRNLYDELEEYFDKSKEEKKKPTLEEVREAQGDITEVEGRLCTIEKADACKLVPSDTEDVDEDEDQISLPSDSVDVIVTSPPYWKKRDYGIDQQLGQESDPEQYIDNLIDALSRWQSFLRPTGSIFLNLGDTYYNKSLVGVPGLFVQRAQQEGWTVRNHLIWSKNNGMPSSVKDRLVSRHEHIFHLVQQDDYYYDLFGYSKAFGNGSNPGDVWNMTHDRNTGGHLAPYPEELVQRAITLACPPAVCTECGTPRERVLERPLKNLDTTRSQAQRALDKFENSDLEEKHLKAIRSKGISDAGKAKEFQEGADMNSESVDKLAKEAKDVLGGYFREFTFAKPVTKTWEGCDCDAEAQPGLVFDPFTGSGTTIKVAHELGYHAFGTDLDKSNFQPPITQYSTD